MTGSRRWIVRFVVFAFFYYYLAFPKDAQAYLDAGTGSIIFQALIGGLAGALFALKIFWNQIKGFFKRLFRRTKRDEKREEAEE
jgi:hypothetical protein